MPDRWENIPVLEVPQILLDGNKWGYGRLMSLSFSFGKGVSIISGRPSYSRIFRGMKSADFVVFFSKNKFSWHFPVYKDHSIKKLLKNSRSKIFFPLRDDKTSKKTRDDSAERIARRIFAFLRFRRMINLTFSRKVSQVEPSTTLRALRWILISLRRTRRRRRDWRRFASQQSSLHREDIAPWRTAGWLTWSKVNLSKFRRLSAEEGGKVATLSLFPQEQTINSGQMKKLVKKINFWNFILEFFFENKICTLF